MSSALQKALNVLEYLSERPLGAQVSEMAADLGLPVSGVHRLLKELESIGYVRQLRDMGDYQLTIKLASMGLCFLGRSGINDISQPILDNLAKDSRELVRLSLADGEQLFWVGVAQGATAGLRYDPGSEQGQVVHLASSAGGQAWLSAMSDEDALQAVMKQGLVKPGEHGPDAPETVAQLQDILKQTRKRGYSLNANSFMLGMAAMAVVVRDPDSGKPIGAVSIAGPSVRLQPEVMHGFADALMQAAAELGEASRASHYFSSVYRTRQLKRTA